MTSDPRTGPASSDNGPPDRDLVAAEYALGTLRGREREDFRSRLRTDRDLQASVARWQDRLSGMVSTVETVAPSADLWNRIDRAIGPARDTRPVADKGPADTLAARLRRWLAPGRLFPLGGAALAGALTAALLLLPGTQPRPVAGPALIAVLQDGTKPVFAVRSGPGSATVTTTVTAVGGTAAPAGRSYELWAVAGDAAPVSLGVLGAAGSDGPAIRLAPGRLPAGLLRPGIVLAVSLEPAGGSPTGAPTGPVLFTGILVEAL